MKATPTSAESPAGIGVPEALNPASINGSLLDLRSVALRLIQGSAIYAVANFSMRAVSFLLLPIYTRYLAPADYGTITLAEITALIIANFCGLGLENGITRYYYQYVDRPGELRDFLASVLKFGSVNSAAVVLLCVGLGAPLMRWAGPRFDVAFFPYIALAIATAGVTQLVNFRLSLYQAEKRARNYAWLAAGFFVLTTAFSLALVVGRRAGALGMLAGKMASAVLSASCAIFLLKDWWRGKLRWGYVRETLALSVPVIPHQLIALGLVAADRFIVERYRDLTEVGLYSLAYTFGMVMAVVTTSLMLAWSPVYFDVNREGEQGRQIVGRIGSGMAFGLIAVALFGSVIAKDFVAVFLDPRYRAVGPLIPWIIGGYLMHAMFSLLHLALFQAKRTVRLWQLSFVAFAANIALNFLLVPRWGMYGAAWATMAAYLVEAVVVYFYAQHLFPIPFRTARVLAGLAVYGGVLALTQVASPAHHVAVMAVTLVVSWGVLAAIARQDLQTAWQRLRVERRSAAS